MPESLLAQIERLEWGLQHLENRVAETESDLRSVKTWIGWTSSLLGQLGEQVRALEGGDGDA